MPMYHLHCQECQHTWYKWMYSNDLLELNQGKGDHECEACGKKNCIRRHNDDYGASIKLTPGTPGYERREMQNRYKKRNAKLDAMPADQQKQMSKFMNQWGVRKEAPSGYLTPPKTQEDAKRSGLEDN